MKALIAVDGSPGGFEAVRQMARLLDPQRDPLALYYSPPGIHMDRGSAAPEVLSRARESLAAAVLEDAKMHLPAEFHPRVEVIVGHEPPKQGIVAAAEKWGAGLIAVGARGLGAIQRMLLGSVSSSVVAASRVPVLVARPRPAERADAPLAVLLACESATDDQQLADIARALHWPPDTHGLTLSVVQSMFAGHVPSWLQERARSEEVEAMARVWVAEHETEIANKQAEITQYCSSLPAPFQTNTLVLEGHPANQILAVAADRKIDLILIGDRTSSSVTRFLMGSTPQSVLNESPCSVMIVRERGNG